MTGCLCSCPSHPAVGEINELSCSSCVILISPTTKLFLSYYLVNFSSARQSAVAGPLTINQIERHPRRILERSSAIGCHNCFQC